MEDRTLNTRSILEVAGSAGIKRSLNGDRLVLECAAKPPDSLIAAAPAKPPEPPLNNHALGGDEGDGQPEGGEEEPAARQKIKIMLADGKERTIQHMMATTFWSVDGRPMSASWIKPNCRTCWS
jgi:hypothetical protein